MPLSHINKTIMKTQWNNLMLWIGNLQQLILTQKPIDLFILDCCGMNQFSKNKIQKGALSLC